MRDTPYDPTTADGTADVTADSGADGASDPTACECDYCREKLAAEAAEAEAATARREYIAALDASDLRPSVVELVCRTAEQAIRDGQPELLRDPAMIAAALSVNADVVERFALDPAFAATLTQFDLLDIADSLRAVRLLVSNSVERSELVEELIARAEDSVAYVHEIGFHQAEASAEARANAQSNAQSNAQFDAPAMFVDFSGRVH